MNIPLSQAAALPGLPSPQRSSARGGSRAQPWGSYPATSCTLQRIQRMLL